MIKATEIYRLLLLNGAKVVHKRQQVKNVMSGTTSKTVIMIKKRFQKEADERDTDHLRLKMRTLSLLDHGVTEREII